MNPWVRKKILRDVLKERNPSIDELENELAAYPSQSKSDIERRSTYGKAMQFWVTKRKPKSA